MRLAKKERKKEKKRKRKRKFRKLLELDIFGRWLFLGGTGQKGKPDWA